MGKKVKTKSMRDNDLKFYLQYIMLLQNCQIDCQIEYAIFYKECQQQPKQPTQQKSQDINILKSKLHSILSQSFIDIKQDYYYATLQQIQNLYSLTITISRSPKNNNRNQVLGQKIGKKITKNTRSSKYKILQNFTKTIWPSQVQLARKSLKILVPLKVQNPLKFLILQFALSQESWQKKSNLGMKQQVLWKLYFYYIRFKNY
eukprot:TRINITY_DN7668_c1_g2_i2.p1 TRINITY_DN7668_c1_g2~~TRINITY_DN7668_c1_g2_i2.p1  ORF type:complete len:203 (+),score=-14.75 TRINITY_DN7668_c1_g2_i2:242-850(+)